MSKFSYFKTAASKSDRIITTDELFNLIRNKSLQKSTQKIRNETDKEKRTKLKLSLLPAVTVSGTFRNGTHQAKDLDTYSGLMQIDFDNVSDVEAVKTTLSKDKYTLACFTSPSGNGIKCIVKITPDAKLHNEHFTALEKYYSENFDLQIDTKVKSISSLMFLCHDAELFVNENSEIFTTPKTKDKP